MWPDLGMVFNIAVRKASTESYYCMKYSTSGLLMGHT